MLIDVFKPFVIQRLDLIFSSFLVDFLSGACLSRALLESQKKFKTQARITVFCGNFPVYFLEMPYGRVNVKIPKAYEGSTFSFLL